MNSKPILELDVESIVVSRTRRSVVLTPGMLGIVTYVKEGSRRRVLGGLAWKEIVPKPWDRLSRSATGLTSTTVASDGVMEGER